MHDLLRRVATVFALGIATGTSEAIAYIVATGAPGTATPVVAAVAAAAIPVGALRVNGAGFSIALRGRHTLAAVADAACTLVVVIARSAVGLLGRHTLVVAQGIATGTCGAIAV